MATDPIAGLTSGMSIDIGSSFGTLAKVLAIIGVAGFIALGAGLIFWMFFQRMKYNKQVHIYYRERGLKTPMFKKDVGGVFLNKKTNMKRFWIKGENVGLSPDNIPFLFNNKGGKVVTLWQTGLKNFRFANFNIDENPGFSMQVGDEDVNWAISTFQDWKARFQTKNWLEQYGHMLLWAITIIGTLMLVFFIAQKFDVLSSVASSLNSAAEAMRDASRGTIIK